MIRKLLSTVLLLTVVTLSFTACTGKKEPVISQSAVVSTSETSVSVSTETSVSVSSEVSVSQETSVSEHVSPTEEDKHPIEVLVVNQCNADIGTVAIIDPVEGTQENVGALKDGTVMTLKFDDWPEDVTTFDIAFYNNVGDLVSESSIDITGVKEKVTVMLSGNGNIENVEGIID